MKTDKLIGLAVIIGIIVFGLTAILSIFSIEERVGLINPWLEALIFLFLLISVVILVRLAFIHKKDVWKPLIIFFLSGVVLITLMRLMISLYDLRVLEISGETFEVLAHFIFYLSMTCFLITLGKVINIEEKASRGKRLGFLRSDLIILLIFGILVLVFFFGAESLDSWILSWFKGSFADAIGLHHFIAFIFAIFVSSKLIWVRFFITRESYDKNMVTALFGSFFIFLLLMSLNHFWELLTESWKILVFSESFIETVEQIFWLPASIFLFYSIWKASNIKEARVKR